MIIREKLKFPSGFGAAVLIGVLHGRKRQLGSGKIPADFASLAGEETPAPAPTPALPPADATAPDGDDPAAEHEVRRREEWRSNLRLLLACFLVSGLLTLATYFFPAIRNVPVFGSTAAATWLWTFNPSLAYIGQGVIMGTATTMHMLLGAIIGWAVLSPMAKYRGWAPGPIEDWETGSKGWIVWISIAIMLADGIVSLSHIAARSAIQYWPEIHGALGRRLSSGFGGTFFRKNDTDGYTAVRDSEDNGDASSVPASPLSDFARPVTGLEDDEQDGVPDATPAERDAPPNQQIGSKTVSIGLVLSILFCIVSIRVTFGPLVPLYATVVAIAMALVLSIMGVRALGEVGLPSRSRLSSRFLPSLSACSRISRRTSTLCLVSPSSRNSSLP